MSRPSDLLDEVSERPGPVRSDAVDGMARRGATLTRTGDRPRTVTTRLQQHRGTLRGVGGDGERSDETRRLREVPLFDGVDPPALAALLALGQMARVPPGAVLLPADSHRSVVVVLEGAAVTAPVADDQSDSVCYGPGSVIGAASLFAGAGRARGVVARTPVTALLLDERSCRALLRDHPVLSERVVRLLAERLVAMSSRGDGEGVADG